MKKYLAWKKSEEASPALACPAPIAARAPTGGIEWPALTTLPSLNSPPPPTTTTAEQAGFSCRPAGLGFAAGPSAFSVVPPATLPLPPSLPPLYSSLMCLPALIDKLGGSTTSNILRSQMTSTFKPIPNNEKVDLARFRVKEPHEWVVDDVVTWMLDVSKRHGIPFEEMNMHKFASLNGPQLLQMTEQSFRDRDPVWGSLFFNELKNFIASSEDPIIDDLMRKYRDTEEDSAVMLPSTSFDRPAVTSPSTANHSQLAASIAAAPGLAPQQTFVIAPPMSTTLTQQLNQTLNNTLAQTLNQSLNQSLNNTLSQTLNSSGLQALNSNIAQNLLNQSIASTIAAGFNAGLSPMNLGLIQSGLSPSSPLINAQQLQQKISPMPMEMKYNPGSVDSDYDMDERLHGVESKIRKNKDGRPRKRSQHTKGNKLWEFIRDALKDPSTCPSVVRWEDPIEGVFRIVESEKLARLWGERKNNTKMTYEKLSRAMRTYYEKQILVPVPKTGLYPKKLVYKFGPGAHGWDVIKGEPL